MSFITDLLNVPSSDTSAGIIKELFGITALNGTALSGGKISLFNTLFEKYNGYLLSFAILLYGFIVIVGTINTAKDGQFLGRDWDSYWYPLRIIFGSIMVVPYTSGYCLAQYFVFMCVAAGASFANSIWSTVNHDVYQNNIPPVVGQNVNSTIGNIFGQYMINTSANAVIVNLVNIAKNVDKNNELCGIEKKEDGTMDISCNMSFNLTADKENLNTYAPAFSDSPNAVVRSIFSYAKEGKLEWTEPTQTSYVKTKVAQLNLNGTYIIQYQPPSSTKKEETNHDSCTGMSSEVCLLKEKIDEYLNTNLKFSNDDPSDRSSDEKTKLDQTIINAQSASEAIIQYLNQVQQLSSIDIDDDEYELVPYDSSGARSQQLNNAYNAMVAKGTVISVTVTGIIHALELMSGPGAGRDNQEIDTTSGWWDADQKYLQLDNNLARNLQALYSNFGIFLDDVASINTSYNIKYDTVSLKYFREDEALEDLVKGGQNTFSSVPSEMKGQIAETDLPDNLQHTASFPMDMASVRNTFIRLIDELHFIDPDDQEFWDQTVENDNGIVKPYDYLTQKKDIDDYLGDRLSFQYAQYYYLISTLVDSIMQSADAREMSKADKIMLYKNLDAYIMYMVRLMSYLAINGVDNLGLSYTPPATDAAGPAQDMIDSIFNKMGYGDAAACINYAATATGMAAGALLPIDVLCNNHAGDMDKDNSLFPTNLINQIYTVGFHNSVVGREGIEDQEGQDDGDAASTPASIVSNSYSQLQQLQAIGYNLMVETINSAMNVLERVSEQMNQVKKFASSQMTTAAVISGAGALASLANPFGGANVIGQWIGGVAVAKATFNVGYLMAEFALSTVWLPIMLYVLSSIFAIGVLFAIIIPMTPFILFWAGKIAWLLLVIEAAFAAPLMALGIAYPEGHNVFGKAQPGIQMLLGLTLRPALMICGLFVGIVLTYVIVGYSADAFHNVASTLMDFLPPSSTGKEYFYAQGIFALLLVFMYASFIALVFTKCWSPIYELPRKVLEWVGGKDAASDSGADDARQMEQKTSGYADSAAQSGGQSLERGVSTKQDNTKQYTSQEQGMVEANNSGSSHAASNGRNHLDKKREEERRRLDNQGGNIGNSQS